MNMQSHSLRSWSLAVLGGRKYHLQTYPPLACRKTRKPHSLKYSSCLNANIFTGLFEESGSPDKLDAQHQSNYRGNTEPIELVVDVLGWNEDGPSPSPKTSELKQNQANEEYEHD